MAKHVEKKAKTVEKPIPEPIAKPASSSPIPALVASLTVKGARAEFRDKYGFTPSEPFCQDLIDYVNEMTNGGKTD